MLLLFGTLPVRYYSTCVLCESSDSEFVQLFRLEEPAQPDFPD